MRSRRVAYWLLVLSLIAFGTVSRADSGLALPDDPLEGRLLFESRNCIRCHGLAGGGGEAGTSIGPDLGHTAFGGSLLDLGAALWNHVPGMSVSLEDAQLPWPELAQTEVVELTAFLYFIEYLGQPGDAVRGRRLFRNKSCQECHDLSGFAARGGAGPSLAGLENFASPLFVAQAIWNHGPEMFETIRTAGMTIPSFDEGDLADLSAFFRQTAPGGRSTELALLAPGNPNRGGQLFRDRGCSLCHGKNATGGADGPDLTRSDLHRSAETIASLMWNHASAMSDMMKSRGVGWPRFTTAELTDLIAYLYFLPFADRPGDPRRGEDAFEARSCAECHGGGATAHEGPDLADTPASRSAAAFIAALWSHAPVMKEAILGEGKPWPELSGDDLRNLLAYLQSE